MTLPDDPSGRRADLAALAALTPDAVREVLSDPDLFPRCSCGAYWCDGWLITDRGVVHTEDLCQPRREAFRAWVFTTDAGGVLHVTPDEGDEQ